MTALSDVWKQFVTFESITEIWKNQPTYIIVQILFIIGGIVTLLHAFTYGGRRPLLWICIICHGLVIECVSYAMTEIDNFWHSRAPVMFFGQRLPLYVIILYSVFYYIAIDIAYRTNRGKIGFMVTVGLNVFLIDLPYDIIGIKFIHWTWHDTDPNIGDRIYWVPWTSFYFHMVFSASFAFWFFTKDVNLDHTYTRKREIIISLKSILFSTPCGILCFSILYHPLHEFYNVPTHVIMMFLIAFYVMIAIFTHKPRKNVNLPLSIIIFLIVYYATFLCLAIWGKPEHEVSSGPHEEIGPCNITVPTFGTGLTKRKYLCVEDFNEDFDFHCIQHAPSQYSKNYTVCGTAFKNRIEYVTLLITIIIVAFTQFNVSYKIIKETKKCQ